MKIQTAPLLLSVALLSGGCVSPQQRAQMQAQNNAQIEARYEQLMVGFRAVCRDYGFKDGTDKFAECVQQESNRWLQNAKQAKAEQEYRDRCFLGTTNICDKPRETTCLKDAWGNFRCQGQ